MDRAPGSVQTHYRAGLGAPKTKTTTSKRQIVLTLCFVFGPVQTRQKFLEIGSIVTGQMRVPPLP